MGIEVHDEIAQKSLSGGDYGHNSPNTYILLLKQLYKKRVTITKIVKKISMWHFTPKSKEKYFGGGKNVFMAIDTFHLFIIIQVLFTHNCVAFVLTLGY